MRFESLAKKLCPLEIIKGMGAEAIWMYNTAQKVKASVAEMTFEVEEELPLQAASITYYHTPEAPK